MNKYKIEEQDINKMKEHSPLSLPDNPSGSGYSADKIKRLLCDYVFNNNEGLIKVLNDIFTDNASSIDGILQLLDEIKNSVNTHKSDDDGTFKHNASNIKTDDIFGDEDYTDVSSVLGRIKSMLSTLVIGISNNQANVNDILGNKIPSLYGKIDAVENRTGSAENAITEINAVINKFFDSNNIDETLDTLKEIVDWINEHKNEYNDFFNAYEQEITQLQNGISQLQSLVANKVDTSTLNNYYDKAYIDTNIPTFYTIGDLREEIHKKQNAYSVYKENIFGLDGEPIVEFGQEIQIRGCLDLEENYLSSSNLKRDDNINIVEFGVPDYWVAKIEGGVITLYARETEKQFTQVSETEFATIQKQEDMLYFVVED